ncbi:MAG: glycosyltransferase family 39 protein [Acidobacteriia bacterium]|nr:glycosyltransferase family 39 protein [Terriglobia bacterium]
MRTAAIEKTLLFGTIALGAVLRIAHFLGVGSLWHDEACLALNIVQRNFFQLLKPLDYDQVSPIGYLWIEKAVTLLLGSSEAALRLPSLLASLAVLVLIALLANRLFGIWCAIVATAAIAVSPLWIYYAAELKSYSLDAALALCILLWLQSLLSNTPHSRHWYYFLASAAVALFLSESIVLVLVSIAAALAIASPRKYRPQAAALAAISLIVAGALYFAVYRAESHGVFLKGYWAQYEIALATPGFKTRLSSSFFEMFSRSLDSLAPYSRTSVNILLAGLGAWLALRRRQLVWIVALVCPFLLLFLASFAGAYPIAPRTILFALPLLILLIAIQVAWLAQAIIGRRAIWLAPCTLVLLAFLARGVSLSNAKLSPEFPRVSKEAVGAYQSRRDCDPLYVFSSSMPVWLFYSRTPPHSPHPSPELVHNIVERNNKRVFAQDQPFPGALAPQHDGCRTVLFGELPPQQTTVPENYDWAAAEMRRIATTGARRVYVFGELFSSAALDSLRLEAAKCGGTETTVLTRPGRGYLGELLFPKDNSCR